MGEVFFIHYKSEPLLAFLLMEVFVCGFSWDKIIWEVPTFSNPNAKSEEDTRTPEELLDVIEAKGREVSEAIKNLRWCGRADSVPCTIRFQAP